jgi:protein-tyrosine kinase
VSRINEALRRVHGKQLDQTEAAKNQHQFMPAWPVKNLEGGNPEDNEAGAAAAVHDGILEPPIRSKRGIVKFSSEWKERVAGPDGDPHLLEQFRRLAATLHHAHLNNGLSSVMVTSALGGDGKTLTSINLALVLAESYRYNVLLIDADLRQPSIPNVVEIGEGSGLSEALRAPTEHKLALVGLTPRLTLLPAGQPIANSIEALTSPRMRHILEEAAGKFDWVILDAPPVGPTTDARLLTQMVGGTLFVVRAGKTQHADVKKAIDSIGREQILGVVLNGVDPGTDEEYYGAPGAK